MTETEWLECADWRDLFEYLEGKTSDRKLRLFAVACCRYSWRLLGGDSRRAVEVAERFADGLATSDELHAAREVFRASDSDQVVEVICGRRYRPDFGGSTADDDALWAAKCAMRQSADAEVWNRVRSAGTEMTSEVFGSILSAEMATRRRMLHELIGPLPFRPVTVDLAWLTSHVVASAEGIYRDHAFDRLPILADALQDAGCDNDDIIGHCRSEGPHVRGCWVVDLLTGRM